MSKSRRQILEQLQGVRALIVGDVMVDEYLFGEVGRISPDAPVPVVALGQRREHLGGASNVASNLAALSADTTLVGVVGDDADGERLQRLLGERGIANRLVKTGTRPTTRKTRIIARNQQLIRLDAEVARPLDADERERVLAAVRAENPQVVILSDYGKGVVSRELAQAVIAWARAKDVPVVVDPKSTDFTTYRGASFLTPNTKETQAATRMPVQTVPEVVAAGRKLIEETGAKGVLITRGELGMGLVEPEGTHFVSAHKRNVYDVTGAGDTVIATFAACLAVGAVPSEAMALSNWAAGIVVGRLGAATCTRDEIAREAGIDLRGEAVAGEDPRLAPPRLHSREDAARLVEAWKGEGRRVVFTNGCFDLLHAGHVILLEEARARGDALVVGLNSDASVRRLKGPSRLLQTLRDRARIVGALHMVDMVVGFDEDTPLETVLALKPDVIVKGGDYSPDTIVGAKEVQAWGGEVAVIPLLADRSTTRLAGGRPA